MPQHARRQQRIDAVIRCCLQLWIAALSVAPSLAADDSQWGDLTGGPVYEPALSRPTYIQPGTHDFGDIHVPAFHFQEILASLVTKEIDL